MQRRASEVLTAHFLQLLVKLAQLTLSQGLSATRNNDQCQTIDPMTLVAPTSMEDPLRKLIRDFLRWLRRCHEWDLGQQSKPLEQAESQILDLANRLGQLSSPCCLSARDRQWKPGPVIAVVGPLPDQFRKVFEACGCPPTLLYVDKDVSRPRFPGRVAKIILWVDKLSHAWDKPAIDQVGRENVHKHRGGLKQMIDLIKNLTNEL